MHCFRFFPFFFFYISSLLKSEKHPLFVLLLSKVYVDFDPPALVSPPLYRYYERETLFSTFLGLFFPPGFLLQRAGDPGSSSPHSWPTSLHVASAVFSIFFFCFLVDCHYLRPCTTKVIFVFPCTFMQKHVSRVLCVQYLPHCAAKIFDGFLIFPFLVYVKRFLATYIFWIRQLVFLSFFSFLSEEWLVALSVRVISPVIRSFFPFSYPRDRFLLSPSPLFFFFYCRLR